MNHPTGHELLLLAYGELPEPVATNLESHVAACGACQEQLAQLERARVALDVMRPARRRRVAVWAGFAIAAAAALAGVLISEPSPSRGSGEGWRPTTTWSTTAGYVAGGKAMRDIDEQLTRLEQEWPYGRP
jgi:anti-sigma factor RsiW